MGGVEKKKREEPHERRRGQLRHGNPSGDLSVAPRCRARTRRLTECSAPAMANGRCRLHGGHSTGPRTLEGIERIRKARTKHGIYSAEFREQRKAAAETYRKMQELLELLGD